MASRRTCSSAFAARAASYFSTGNHAGAVADFSGNRVVGIPDVHGSATLRWSPPFRREAGLPLLQSFSVSGMPAASIFWRTLRYSGALRPISGPIVVRYPGTGGSVIAMFSAPMATWAVKNNIKKVVTLVADYGPGIDAETAFKNELVKGGGTVTLSGGRVAGPPDLPPASNLTPAGIGHWQEADFVRALREGIRPDGRRVFCFCVRVEDPALETAQHRRALVHAEVVTRATAQRCKDLRQRSIGISCT